MPVIRPGAPATVTLNIGQTLVVTADAGSIGAVTRGGRAVATIKPGAPVHIGRPGTYALEADTGSLAYQVNDPLSGALTGATRNIQSFRTIQTALIQGQQMALSGKFARLAERARAVPAALDKQADETLGRLDAVEKRGEGAFTNLHQVVTDAEQGVQAAEDAVNQLTNGAPA